MASTPPAAQAERTTRTWTLRPRRVVTVLGVVVAALVAVSFAGQLLVRLAPEHALVDLAADRLSVDSERSIPTVFSMALLLATAAVAAFIATSGRGRGDVVRRWWVPAVVLALAGAEEVMQFHEWINDVMSDGPDDTSARWVVPALLVVAAVAVVSIRFVVSLPRDVRRLMIAAGALYLGGALGLEALGGTDYGPGLPIGTVLLKHAEEALEMGGALLALYAALVFIERHGADTAALVTFAPAAAPRKWPGRVQLATSRRFRRLRPGRSRPVVATPRRITSRTPAARRAARTSHVGHHQRRR